MSRIIVTKEQRASLARDTSRSRPHRVESENKFDVFPEFIRSAKRFTTILEEEPPKGLVTVCMGDARDMRTLDDGVVDAVITSPPYLNAIDYLRGHKMLLVWMGHSIAGLRKIRSSSIGAERGPDTDVACEIIESVLAGVGEIGKLPRRHQRMVERYVCDLYSLMKEVSRVMRAHGQATFVVGNSCLRGVFVRNSGGVAKAAEMNGLCLVDETERDLPDLSRSLPMMNDEANALSKRMRTENVMVFERKTA